MARCIRPEPRAHGRMCERRGPRLPALPAAWLRRSRIARTLRELDRHAWRVSDPRSYIEEALARVVEVLGAAGAGFVSTFAEGGPRLEVACGLPFGAGFVVEDAAVRRLLQAGGGARVYDLGREAPDSLRERGLDGGLLVAVTGSHGPHGALGVVFCSGKPGREAVRFLEGVAERIAFVLERWQAEEALERRAHYDSLTGLPNRRLLLRHLRRHIEGPGGEGWLALLSGEDFDDLHDAWGHEAGRALLRELVRRLALERARGGWVARCGEARFALWVPGSFDEERLQEVLRRLEWPLAREGQTLRLVFRAGVARFPDHGREARELLHNAGVALAEARLRGQRFAVYRPGLGGLARKRARMERVRGTLLRGVGVELAFQPVVDLASGDAIWAEALVRWRDPANERLVYPDAFVPLVEELGMARTLDRLVFERAVRAGARWWRALGEDAPRVAVNVAPESLLDAAFVEFVVGLVQALPASKRPVLELTERLFVEAGGIAAALRRLREAGVWVVLDDLGTGYAALGSLVEMEVDAFKIDRSLIAAVDRSERSRALVRAILQLGRDLGLLVVAEGVESARQLEHLRREGCRYVQGFFLGRPHPEPRFLLELRRRGSQPAAPARTLDTRVTDAKELRAVP